MNYTKMSDAVLQSHFEEANKNIDILSKEYVEVRDRWAKANEMRKEIESVIGSRKIKSMTDSIDWDYILEETGNTSIERHKAATEKLATLGLSHSGYNAKTLQRSISIRLIKNDENSVKKTEDGLNVVLPFIKKVQMSGIECDVKVLDIFEPTLSQFRSYTILINEDAEYYSIGSYFYGSFSNDKSCKTLHELLMYLQENHGWGEE
jgi:hypothetical protein